MRMLLERGAKYGADLSLGFFEKMAGNEAIRSKLEEAGFSSVRVWGSGASRHAEGVWASPTQEVELPSQVARAWVADR